MLGLAAALCLFRLYRGPSALDRILAIDVLLVIFIAGVALESVWNHRNQPAPDHGPRHGQLRRRRRRDPAALARLRRTAIRLGRGGLVAGRLSSTPPVASACSWERPSASQGLSAGRPLPRHALPAPRRHQASEPGTSSSSSAAWPLPCAPGPPPRPCSSPAARSSSPPCPPISSGERPTGTGAWTTATWTSTSCPRPSSVATEPDDG